ncbi:cytochrome P450 [Leptodontidium sp. 2 PMI_412]|nr:cytochrome P450 [Leptodontidium sp. 2 PMI_412]
MDHLTRIRGELGGISPFLLGCYFVGTLILCIPIYRLVRAVFSPMRSVPGPFLARFSRLWLLRECWDDTWHKKIVNLHCEFGALVRLAPNEYSVDDPDAIKLLYGSGINAWVKGPWYTVIGDPSANIPDLFSDTNPHRHAQDRRFVASFFNLTTQLKMEERVDDCLRQIEKKFNEFAESGQKIDLVHWLQCFAHDVVGAITVDKPFGYLEEGEDTMGFFTNLGAALVYVARVAVYPKIHPIIARIIQMLGANGVFGVFAFVNKQVAERLDQINRGEKKDDAMDFLTRVLKLHNEQPKVFTMEHVEVACFQNIGAGSDTTSIALSAILGALIENPKAMDKLRKEIDDSTDEGKLSDPPSFAETKELPYLQAVIKESLRLHAPFGVGMQRVVPAGGATIAGKYVPKGTLVSINAWAAHANKSVFGEDVDVFRPERWLVGKEKIQEMERYWLAFGSGGRACLGKNIALMEISKLVTTMARKFEIHREGKNTPLENYWVGFVKKKDFTIALTKRKC